MNLVVLSGILIIMLYLTISDGGTVSKMNLDGTGVTNWTIGGDLEGITITDPTSKYVYIIVEYPFQLIQFDPSTGTKVKTISLTGVVPATVATNQGIEGIAYVPNGYHPYPNTSTGGVFYLGLQEKGPIHVVDVDFTSGTAKLIDSFTPVAGRGDISDLYFSTETKTLYILYDGANKLREITTNKDYAAEYDVPGSEQEGVAILPSCPNAKATIFIAEDTPTKLMKYNNYPETCTITPPKDSDGDGYTIDIDCNDNDAQINPGKTEIIDNKIDDDCNALTLDRPDADGDGILDPYDKCPGFDDKEDLDFDGIPDGCDLSDDRDSDGLTNAQEAGYGTDPLLADTDNDGLTDKQEIFTHLTNPLVVDSDGGGVSDGQEIINKTNPLNASDDIPIDPNVISSYTINSNATVLVKYADNTELTIDPFIGTSKISVATNTKKDRLIVTDGKYLSIYKRNTLVVQTKIKSSTSKTTMTVTDYTTYDLITVKYSFFWVTTTVKYKLENDKLTIQKSSKTKPQKLTPLFYLTNKNNLTNDKVDNQITPFKMRKINPISFFFFNNKI